MSIRNLLPASLFLLLSLFATTSLQAQIDVWNYWLMPHGTYAQTQNQLHQTGQIVAGQHSFWRGTMWGRTVALQGDPSVSRYDIFVENGSVLEYWGTFRGNGASDEVSHSFDSPFRWMNASMFVGQAVENTFTVRELRSDLRKQTSSGSITMRLEINALYSSWTVPQTGQTFQDVLKITFFSDKSNPSSREIYHLARGKGTIHFESFNTLEPSGVQYSWVTGFASTTFPAPTIPWFDPFLTRSGQKGAVYNGFFEDPVSKVNGGAVNSNLHSWSATSGDCVVTTDNTTPGDSAPWRVALRGSAGGGDGAADAITSEWIPVTGGRTYRLSGWLWRVSASDNVYLDFNDGVALGASFPDRQAVAASTNSWELRSVDVTLPSATTHVKVRAVRDGANQGNAYFDGIMIQRLN